MPLTTLWAVARTVNSEWQSPIASAIARSWRSDVEPRYVRSSANFVFRADLDGDPYFLRFAHESERERDEIVREMELLVWLIEQGLRVNRPAMTSDGELVATVETELGRFHAVMLSRVEGTHLDIESIGLSAFGAWGAAVGVLHQAFDRMPDYLRRPPAWQTTIGKAAQCGGLLSLEAAALGSELRSLGDAAVVCGTIHSDVELDNLLWDGESFGFIDFDEFITSWRAAEIAKALADLEVEEIATDPRGVAFVTGYRRHHDFPDESLATLPPMTRLFDLGMYLRLQRALAEPLDSEGSEHLAGLVGSLSGWMKRFESGLAARFGR